MESFSSLEVILLYFSPESKLITAVLNRAESECFDNYLRQEYERSHKGIKLKSLKVSRQLSMKMVKCEDVMLILDQNWIYCMFCGQCVVNFSM